MSTDANTSETDHLFAEALKLTSIAREQLAMRLLKSCDEPQSAPELDPAWDAEVARRVEDITSGRVKGIPSEEVFKELRKRRGG